MPAPALRILIAWLFAQMSKCKPATEQVVTMLFNDVVKSFFNTRKGAMYNEPRGSDVYSGVEIDYSGKQITPKNFLGVLRGDATAMRGVGTGRVIASGPNDRVFVYFADHGAPGILAFPSKLLLIPVQLYARDLIRTLKDMHGAGKYGAMVLYVEACESGSVFNGLLPSNISAMAVTAASPQETRTPQPFQNPEPPWRQPRGKLMVSFVNSHTNATIIGWHLWEIDLIFVPELPPGWP